MEKRSFFFVPSCRPHKLPVWIVQAELCLSSSDGGSWLVAQSVKTMPQPQSSIPNILPVGIPGKEKKLQETRETHLLAPILSQVLLSPSSPQGLGTQSHSQWVLNLPSHLSPQPGLEQEEQSGGRHEPYRARLSRIRYKCAKPRTIGHGATMKTGNTHSSLLITQKSPKLQNPIKIHLVTEPQPK